VFVPDPVQQPGDLAVDLADRGQGPLNVPIASDPRGEPLGDDPPKIREMGLSLPPSRQIPRDMELPFDAATAGTAAAASHLEKIADDHGQRPERVFAELTAAAVEVANALTENGGIHTYLICIIIYMLSDVKRKKTRSRESGATASSICCKIRSLAKTRLHCLNHRLVHLDEAISELDAPGDKFAGA
jgi:hypothetical protein